VTLRATISTPDGKRRYVRRLFATIADRYDVITRVLSYGQDRRWKQRLIGLAALGPADRLLDLACGTGDLVFAAAPHVSRAVGLDVTFRMVQLASRRRAAGPSPSLDSARDDLSEVEWSAAPAPHRRVGLITGDMLALPFPDASFDVVTTGYGLRNVPDLDRALLEIGRVLAPGGRLLSLDFDRPQNAIVRAGYLAYLTVVGSLLGFALHGDPDTYRYIPESIRNYPGAQGVARLMERHGFTAVRVLPVLGGLMAIHVASVPAMAPAHQGETPARRLP
jgi:demethylmenaquinone methyltransferase/2-methoxy-6-polyprenyl-1,4-benzoquinol methylase